MNLGTENSGSRGEGPKTVSKRPKRKALQDISNDALRCRTTTATAAAVASTTTGAASSAASIKGSLLATVGEGTEMGPVEGALTPGHGACNSNSNRVKKRRRSLGSFSLLEAPRELIDCLDDDTVESTTKKTKQDGQSESGKGELSAVQTIEVMDGNVAALPSFGRRHQIPFWIEEDGEMLVQWMREREGRYQAKQQYMGWHPDLQPIMRVILLEWMMELGEEYAIHRDTLGMAFNYIDRFLSKVPSISKSRLQLVGVAALLIASKLEDLAPMQIRELSLSTDRAFSIDQIVAMEAVMVQKLGWELNPVTPFSWLRLYMARCSTQEESTTNWLDAPQFTPKDLARMTSILDCCLLDIQNLQYLPSELAAAVFYECQRVFLSPQQFEKITGYDMDSVNSCWMFAQKFRDITLGRNCTTPDDFLPNDYCNRQFRLHQQALRFVKKNVKPDQSPK